MAQLTNYDQTFYSSIQAGSTQSAKEVVPLLLELVAPKSVADVGCGQGAWLAVFAELGIKTIYGTDGDWVDESRLMIPRNCFSKSDVRAPLKHSEVYDLVISLEVGEHLPSESAETFVGNLVSLGNVIAFSAAVPHQEGTDHVNEQWPAYWIKLFGSRGYRLVDCLRKKLWNNEKVGWWYRQNLLLFVKESSLGDYPHLDQLPSFDGLSIVHPEGYLRKVDIESRLSGWTSLKLASKLVWRAFWNRCRKIFRA